MRRASIYDRYAFEGAGFGIRAVARIIDIGFSQLLGLCAGLLGGAVLLVMQMMGVVAPGWENRVDSSEGIFILVGIVATIFYHTFCEGLHGATLGKLICRLRVIDKNGGKSNLKGAFIRSLGWLVDGIFFGMVGHSSMSKTVLQQRFGDVWGNTVVVKTSEAPEGSRRSAGWFFLAFLLGVNAWVLVAVVAVVFSAMGQ